LPPPVVAVPLPKPSDPPPPKPHCPYALPPPPILAVKVTVDNLFVIYDALLAAVNSAEDLAEKLTYFVDNPEKAKNCAKEAYTKLCLKY
jgi:hypothetical protein